ncbi:MAG: PspA/IM30 family protein [Thermodesulfobacteriota bacterium]|nr:PspA/IM30 family protein [Thermodesulfobacteriota bacterium]
MGIMTRIVKVFKADIHGVMDQLEDQGLLLKQHLRDMEEALTHKETKLKKILASRNQSRQELDRYNLQSERLEKDLAVALEKEKDDIARMLIKKIKPLDDLRDELAAHINKLDEEITRYKDHLEQQQIRYEQLKHRSVEYFHKAEIKEEEKNISGLLPDNSPIELSEEEIELELIKRKKALNSNTL